MLSALLFPFATAFFLSMVLTPFTISFARKFKLVDDPKTHKHPAVIHKKVLPRAGGIPIFISIVLAMVLFLSSDKTLLPIIGAGALVVIIGVLDDKFDLSPYLRFAGNILCASVVVLAGIDMPFITNPLGGILHFTNFSYSFLGITVTIGSLLAVA